MTMKIDQRTYKQTCVLARDAGMIPLENPTKEQLELLCQMAEDCEEVYDPLPEDARLAGWYLYIQTEQAEEQRNSDGVCSISDSGTAVIGLSVEMLENSGAKSPYPRIVALHELSHLSEDEHNERFSSRLMELESELFANDDLDRNDGRRFRSDCRPYNPYATATLVRHDSVQPLFTPAMAYARLTGGGEAEAARRRMLDRQGIGPKDKRTPERARAAMIERHRRGVTK